jgi:protoporphyrinogen oxidase
MPRRHVAVLGGGVAGVVLAWELATRENISATLIERSGRLGGLHRSLPVGGAWYDIGAFAFERQNAIFRTFPWLLDLFVEVPHVSLSITPHHSIDRYPMSLRGYRADNGTLGTVCAASDLIVRKVIHHRRDTLPSFMRYYLGSTLYRRSGLKHYLERFYCTAEENVDIEFAAQRLRSFVPALSLRRNLRRLLREARRGEDNKGSWRCYVRPERGFDEVYGAIGRDLVAHGVLVRLDAHLERIERRGEGYDLVIDGAAERFDSVVSTIPLTSVARLLGAPLERELEHMTLYSLFYRVRGPPVFDGHFFYNFTFDGPWKRLILFSRYYGPHDGDEYFTIEVTRPQSESVSLESLVHEVTSHLSTLDLFSAPPRFVGAHVTENAYPFYRAGDMGRIAAARRLVESYGIELTGRQGRFHYLSSNTAATMSQQVATRIAAS